MNKKNLGVKKTDRYSQVLYLSVKKTDRLAGLFCRNSVANTCWKYRIVCIHK